MKVLHVNDYAWMGGCEVLMHLTVEHLVARGIQVEVFTGDGVPDLRRTPLRYIDSLPARRALRERLGAFAPDVVHLHNVYHLLSPGVLATLRRWRRRHPCRVVMTAHDYHVVCPNPGLRFFRGDEAVLADLARVRRLGYLLPRRWDHRGLPHALLRTAQHLWNYRLWRRRRVVDVFVCPSRFMQGVLERSGLPTVYVPNPVPPAEPAAPKAKGPLHLVFAGRLEPEKGVAELLADLPGEFAGRLTIIGEGETEPFCRRIVHRRGLGDRVRFTGRLSREETIARMAEAHVAVLPSRWYENAPVQLLEALSRRTSILVSDLGGMREIVRASGVGYTFELDEPGTLRRALARIAEDHEAGRLNDFDVAAFLAERSESVYVDRLLEVYEGGGGSGATLR